MFPTLAAALISLVLTARPEVSGHATVKVSVSPQVVDAEVCVARGLGDQEYDLGCWEIHPETKQRVWYREMNFPGSGDWTISGWIKGRDAQGHEVNMRTPYIRITIEGDGIGTTSP